MAVMTFRMSGREFTYDGDREWSAADVFALDDLGMGYDEIRSVFEAAVAGRPQPASGVLRAMCALAYISARRDDPRTVWAEFSTGIHPSTFEVVRVDDAPTTSVPVVRPDTARAAAAAADRAAPPLPDPGGMRLVDLAELLPVRTAET